MIAFPFGSNERQRTALRVEFLGSLFTACGNTHLFEEYGLQAVHNYFEMNAASAAKGTIFPAGETFFAAPLAAQPGRAIQLVSKFFF